jgi:homoserine kinase type II
LAVYTDVSDDALIRHLEKYDIGELHSFKGIAEGVENSNYLFTTDDGSFILTLYEKRVKAEDLPFFLGLMEHLAGKGLSCPVPVHMKSGETLGELAGRPAAIITFLEGFSVKRPRATHCRQLGETLAAFHLGGQDFSISRPNALSIGDWRPLYEKSQAGADTVMPGLNDLIATELEFLETNWPEELPAGVIHADLFTDNVFFLKDRLSGIIDFYFACNDLLAYDLAICLNAWCFEDRESFNTTKARSLVAGYEAVRPLSAEEFDALPILARGAALRFLLTRLYDWLNVPEGALVTPKDPLEYVGKLKFHQGISRTGLYGLEQAGTGA